jgi:hypothetical protein
MRLRNTPNPPKANGKILTTDCPHCPAEYSPAFALPGLKAGECLAGEWRGLGGKSFVSFVRLCGY